MSLDKRLKEILFKDGIWPLYPEDDNLSEKFADIKQAFIDEGWKDMSHWKDTQFSKYEPDYCLTHNMYRSRCAAYPHARKDSRMTGPEWLARFEKELENYRQASTPDNRVFTYYERDIQAAARRAAGVDE